MKKILYSLLVITLAVSFTGCSFGKQAQAPSPSPTPEVSSKNTIIGTGILEADNSQIVMSKAMGSVVSADFSEGDYIKEGQTLYTIDRAAILNNIQKARVNVERAQTNYNQNEDNIRKLTIRSSISGTITKIYPSNGDTISPNGRIADVVEDGVMILKIPFLSDGSSEIQVGSSASVTLIGGNTYTVYGNVSKITSGHITSAEGSVIKNIEISVPNPGTIKKDDRATAIVGNVACNDSGIFDYGASETITAEVSGKCPNISLSVGDHINKGGAIVTLTNDSLTSQQQQNALAIKDAGLALDALNIQLQDYTVLSTVNGTVVKKGVDKGDIINAQNAGNLAYIADMSKLIFKIKVDELDIQKIKEGQKVIVTSDATPDTEYEGIVEFISVTGTLVADAGLYEIKVHVINPTELKPGMNMSGKINLD